MHLEKSNLSICPWECYLHFDLHKVGAGRIWFCAMWMCRFRKGL